MPRSTSRPTLRKPFVGAVILLLFCAFRPPAAPRVVAAEQPRITIGGVIQLGLGAAEDALTRAHAAGAADAVNVSLEAQSVFVEARFAYAGRERTAFSDLGPRDQRCYTALERLRRELLEPGLPNYTTVDDLASTIETSLPYHGRHPIIRSFDPQYIAVGATRYHVRFSGNFPESAADDLAPSLRVGSLTFGNAERSAETLTFDVRIPPTRQGGSESIANSVVTLFVPWDSGTWYQVGPFRHVDTASFSLAFARRSPALPRQGTDRPARDQEHGAR